MKYPQDEFVVVNETVVKARLSTKAAVISFGQTAIALSHLVVAAVLSYYFTKTVYGTYRQVWLIYHTMTPLLTLGLPMSINYFIPQLKESRQKALNIQTYFLLAVLGFLLSSFLFFGSPLISHWFKNQELMKFLRIFSLIPLFTFPTLYYQNLFVCLDKAVLAAKLSLLMASGYFCSAFIPVLLGYSIEEIFIIFIIFSFFQLIIVSYLIFKPFKATRAELEKTLLFKQLKYSIPIGLIAVIGILLKQIDKFFISSMFSTSEFATYINGAFEIPLIGIVTGSVTAVLMPEFVKLLHVNDRAGLIKIWHSAVRKVALIIVPLMFFFLVFATELLTLLFSQKYADSSGIFRIYLLSLPVRITNYGMVLLSLGLSSIVLRYSIYSLILNLGLNFVLVRIIGFPGPAIATVIVIYILAFLQLNKIVQKLKVPLKEIFPWMTLAKIFLVAIVAGGVLLIIKPIILMDERVISFLISVILFGLIFFVIGFALKIISKKDLQIPLRIINNLFRKEKI